MMLMMMIMIRPTASRRASLMWAVMQVSRTQWSRHGSLAKQRLNRDSVLTAHCFVGFRNEIGAQMPRNGIMWETALLSLAQKHEYTIDRYPSRRHKFAQVGKGNARRDGGAMAAHVTHHGAVMEPRRSRDGAMMEPGHNL